MGVRTLLANNAKLYHTGLPLLKCSTFCDAMGKRDCHMFEDMFHAAVDKARMIAKKTKKPFTNPLRSFERKLFRNLRFLNNSITDLQGSSFVTRMKSNGAYKRIKNNSHEKNGVILSDILIRLTGSKTNSYYPKPIRKVKYYDKEYHHTYEFITNNLEMGAQEISGIYKRRRRVELFFKWIKEDLKIKTFWERAGMRYTAS
jgi:hypothetical protein